MDSRQVAGAGDWPTGFMLIQGNRLEALRGLMVAWMRRHPLHPLENDVVLVQSNGIAQWLKLALAANPEDALTGGCGIAAALEVTLPGRFIWQAYRRVLGDLPESSAFDKAPMGWRLYRLLGDVDGLAARLPNPDCLAPLQGFLDGDGDADPRRRHQLALRLADLFDQYQVYRADWLAAWQAGEDVLIRPDGRREPLPDAQRWQPALWRSLLGDVAGETGAAAGAFGHASRAEIHRAFLERAKTHPDALLDATQDRLPRRVIVFGISSLPRQSLEVLEAIAPFSQVMLFVHNPSRHYWGDIVEGRELFRREYRRYAARGACPERSRRVPMDVDETQLHLHGHPLLAAWGKQGRDYIRLLDEHDRREDYEGHFHAASMDIDLFESPLESAGESPDEATLLQQLQDDILELRPLHERQSLDAAIDPRTDRSLEFLIAHGPQREIEILHDQLLDAFERAAKTGDPLHPRDVLVMVPNIDPYAPHIEAVFGRLAPDDSRHIPFHLSDQGQRHRHPLLIGLETLLNLPRSRFAVSELLDLLDLPALRARFGIDEVDLPRLRQWIGGANIRWGLDAPQRASLGLPAGLTQNTWGFGLQRMLLGFATGRSGPWQGIEPYDEIGGLEAALVGPLVQLLETLEGYWHQLQIPRAPDAWTALIGELLDDAFAADGETDLLAIAQVQQALEHWALDCRRGGAREETLPLEVVRDALLSALDEPTLTQRFLAGAVNFATLMPMRAIPFRQIWLLGMNDGDYPRSRRPADFDLMANDYRPGDRSRREDDRYLFLEALLSARERLVIGWVGRGIRDNSVRPPSVLVGQLRDHLAAGWRLANPEHGATLLDALTTDHPLQPFSRRYFQPERPPRLFTYAREWRAVHRDPETDPFDFAQGRPLVSPETVPETPPTLAPPELDAPVRLSALGGFLRHPVRTFYTRRLALYLTEDADAVEDDEVFDFDGLGSWDMRNVMVQSVEHALAQQPDADPQACLRATIRQLARAGRLPLPPFDGVWTESLVKELEAPVETYRSLLQQSPLVCPARAIRLEADGIVLEDSLNDLRQDDAGNRVRLHLQASRLHAGDDLKWYHLARQWPFHLAAQLEGPVTTHLLGPDTDFRLAPLDAEVARDLLTQLLESFLEGLTTLPPLACKTGFAVLRAREDGKGCPFSTYEGGFNRAGEREDHPGYARFWPTYAQLSADTHFEPLIDRLYWPLFRHCLDHRESVT